MSDNDINETPYNEKNILINEDDVNKILSRFDINIKCSNIDLYRKSLVNKSYSTRKNDNFISGNKNCPENCLPLQEESNERYEFLGDSILSTTVANYLYERYPNQQEGFLTKMRSKLVNGHMLSDLCKHIGLEKWIIISKQIEENSGRTNYKILEDVFEAFICAIYMDFNRYESNTTLKLDLTGLGFQVAQKWIINVIEDKVDLAELIIQNNNYKDKLIKYFQHTFMSIPKFYERGIHCVNGKKIFTIIIKNEDQIIGIGNSDTKKKAEQIASKKALKYYNEI